MPNAIRSIGHEDRLSLVGHLTELRARLIAALAALAVAFGVCFWQNHALLRLLNRPLAHQTQRQAGLITPRQLRRNRRYAIAACGAIAALLPSDAITLVLETVPLYLLFEVSLLIATIAERRSRAQAPNQARTPEPVLGERA